MELKDLKGVGDKTLEKLNSLGIYSVTDLLENLPTNYLDMTNITKVEDIVEGEYLLLKVNIIKVYPKQYSKNKLCYIKCDCVCEDLSINLIWFNMPYMEYSLNCGEILVWGILRYENKRYTMINPNIADVGNKYKLKDIKPIYSLKGKIGEVSYRKIIDFALQNCNIPNLLNEHFDLNKIYNNIHFAKSMSQMQNAQEQLAIYDIATQLLCYKVVRNIKKCTPLNCEYPRYVEKCLPYKLTQSQKNALNDIMLDLQSDSIMNRFVLGDVGSGKTIVAHLAMYSIASLGMQCALIAPTEILVKQHYDNFNNIFKNYGLKTCLLTSSINNIDKSNIIEKLKNGEIDILFSTHSCLESDVKFANLKLAVIDEAHRFGVKQKAKFLAKGDCVNCLSMSATPLPRSFAMMIFGDLKISKLYKAESRISNIKTFILRSNKTPDMFAYFANKIKTGSQILVVCPRVVESEGLDLYSVKSVYKSLLSKFKKDEIGLLYGSMKAEEKENIIKGFSSGKIKLLVSTTVIEVGIDICNLDTIAILCADRFGVASLHQLRGRVGRDGRESECYLHCTSYTIPNRIKQLKELNDGVLLSELDAQERGYGDLIGFNQAGKNPFEKFYIKITEEIINTAKAIVDTTDIETLDKELLKKYMQKYDFYQDIVLN